MLYSSHITRAPAGCSIGPVNNSAGISRGIDRLTLESMHKCGVAIKLVLSSLSTRFGFSGKERDAETGLDFFGARYFSSAQGRFTSPDEFKGGIVDPFTGQDIETNTELPYADITDPQTLNKYAYVRNNPLRYTDPDGHCVEAVTCSIEFAGAGTLVGGPLELSSAQS